MINMIEIPELVLQDPLRVKALECAFQLHLPDCYLAAGFVRNLVWDHLHQKTISTPLNDIDVIYFDQKEKALAYLTHEATLKKLMPSVNWQVRNQAKMHQRNGDRPYLTSLDAMGFWPEKETAVAIRQSVQHQGKPQKEHYECIAAFGFESLFNLHITPNPKRDISIVKARVNNKNWLITWPKLVLLDV